MAERNSLLIAQALPRPLPALPPPLQPEPPVAHAARPPLRAPRRAPRRRVTRAPPVAQANVAAGRLEVPPPLPRTDRTSLVPPLVLSGHAATLTPHMRCRAELRDLPQESERRRGRAEANAGELGSRLREAAARAARSGEELQAQVARIEYRADLRGLVRR